MEVAITNALTQELEADVDFGSDDIGGGFRANIAESPLAVPLRELYEKLGLETPKLAIFDRFEPIAVPHRFSILKYGGWAEIISAGVRIEYELGNKTCSIVALIPEHEFVTLGALSFSAAVGANGEASASVGPVPLAKSVKLGTSLTIGAGGAANLAFQGTVTTPRIAAVGKGSRSCEWHFNLDKEPLYGRDIETWAIVVVSSRLKQIPYRMKLFVTRRTAILPTRWESEAQLIQCPIAR